MDKLYSLRSWYTGCGYTNASMKGSITDKEQRDLFFVSLYLLLESGQVDRAQLGVIDIAMRMQQSIKRNEQLALLILLASANSSLGHLYLEPKSSEFEIVLAIQSFVELQKGNTSDQLYSELLNTLFDKAQLEEYFCSAVSHCAEYYAEFTPVITDESSNKVSLLKYDSRFGFYLHKSYTCEIEIAQWLTKKLQASLEVEQALLKKSLHEVLVENPMMIAATPLKFHVRQQAAIALSAQKRFSIVSGGPGTGKTSTVVALLRVLLRVFPTVCAHELALVAPTGRAAARMEESVKASVSMISDLSPSSRDAELTQIHATTIHRFLKYNPGRNRYTYTAQQKHGAKIVIVDEVSMVDAQLFLDMTEAMSDDAIVILLGDHNQLPSVQPGAVLNDLFGEALPEGNASLSAEMINQIALTLPLDETITATTLNSMLLEQPHVLKDAMVVLSKSHRSEKSILELSHAINTQHAEAAISCLSIQERVVDSVKWPLVRKFERNIKRCDGSGVVLYDCSPEGRTGEEPFNALLCSWFDFHYLSEVYVNNPEVAFTRTRAFYPLLEYLAQKVSEEIQCVGDYSTLTLQQKINQTPVLRKIFTEVFDYMNQSQILCVTRNGSAGVTAVNKTLQEYVVRKKALRVEQGVFIGMPVIITKNDYVHNVFNGDCGVVVSLDEKQYIALPNAEGVGLYVVSDIAHFEPAYAITVHKSQGSEYEYSLTVLPKEMNRVMTKEILYTAITRSKYFAGVISSVEGFQQCIESSIRRRSAIARRILNE